MSARLRRLFWSRSRDVRIALDAGAWLAAVPLAFLLRLETLPPLRTFLGLAVVAVAGHLVLSLVLGTDRRSWSRTGLSDLVRLGVQVGLVATFIEVLILWPDLGLRARIPASIAPLMGMGALGLLATGRLATRAWATRRRGAGDRVLIIGTNEAAASLARALQESGHHVVGFLDDNLTRRDLMLGGRPVLGSAAQAPGTAALHQVRTVVVAERPEGWEAIRASLEAGGVRCRVLPGLDTLLLAGSPKGIQEAIRSLTETGHPQNVLVIGGAGYIGSALVPLLLERGYNVRILDLLLYGREPIAPWLDHPRMELLPGDFRNVSRLVEAMQGIDTVVHLGAIVGDPACAIDEELTVETNLMATKLVADVAKGHGIRRFVFASTCSVYGASDGILDEGSALNPVSLYARTKIAAERLLLRLRDDSFRPVILRFGTVYGFSGRTRFDLVINLLAAKACTDGTMTLFGGDQWRPFIHVEDVARAVEAVLRTPDANLRHETYNVGSDGQNHTLDEVARIIQEVVPGSRIVDSGSGADRRNYRVSFARIRDDVGFTPKWTVASGVQQVVDAVQSGRVRDLQDPLHSNVQFLRQGGLKQMDARVYGVVLDALEEAIPQAPVALP